MAAAKPRVPVRLTRRLGVYVVTGTDPARGRTDRDAALAAIEGGADAVQLRGEGLSDDDLLALATELASRCSWAGVLFIVNNRIDIALASGADGVHLGQGDGFAQGRAAIGPQRILGVSVTRAQDVAAAEAAGADYLGATVWPTATKPEAVALGLGALREIVVCAHVPVVGIGGITLANAAKVLAAGADGVAVVSAVVAAADPVVATRDLVQVIGSRRTFEGDYS